MNFLIAVVVFFSIYIIWVMNTIGVQKSVSMTDYKNNKKYRNAFEVVLTSCGVGLIYYGIISVIPTIIVAGALIIGVAIWAEFKRSKLYNSLHMLCAFGGFTALAITPIFLGVWYLTIITAALTILTYLLAPNNKLWWTEIVVIYSSFLMLFFV